MIISITSFLKQESRKDYGTADKALLALLFEGEGEVRDEVS